MPSGFALRKDGTVVPQNNTVAACVSQAFPLEEYLSPQELWKALGRSKATFYRAVRPHLDKVPHIPVGRSKRWHYPSVIAALQANGGAA